MVRSEGVGVVRGIGDCLNPDFEDGKDVSELRWAGFLRIWETLGR